MKNKIMHRIYFLFISFILLLYSCSSGSAKYKIGVSQGLDDQWSNYSVGEIQREAALYPNLDVEIKTTHANGKIQSEDINHFVNKGVDVLIILANNDIGMEEAIKNAYDKGIPVILYDGKIKSDKYTTYVSADNYQIGYNAGKYACQLLNEKGNIVEIYAWAKMSAEIERHEGFAKAISEYPNVHIIAELSGEYNMAVKTKQIDDLIRKQIEIDLVFAMNDETALVVYDYYDKKKIKRPMIIGVDAIPETGGGIDAILNNKIDATFIYPTGGDKLIELSNKILRGEPIDKKIILNSSVVNRSNVWILQMQNELIKEQQQKVDNINSLLSKAMVQFSNQKTILYSTIFILILITILLVVSITAYVNMRRLNRILKKQKEQVMDLSKQLEDETNAKLRFFTNISHEFKTPLTLISGPIQTLLKSESLSKEQSQLVNIANRNIETLHNLIVQIMQFRSYEEGYMKPHFEKGDLRKFLEELNVSFHDYAKRNHINLQFYSEPDTIFMQFDKNYIEKIYFNIISNSFRYAKKDIKIRLTIKNLEGTDYVDLLIHNDGKEIPIDEVDKLFNYFFKLDSSDRGTGIGLAFTKSLVSAHNGTIIMYSQPGEGVTVCISLPLEQKIDMSGEDLNYYKKGYTKNELNLEEQDHNTRMILSSEEYPDSDCPILLIIEDNINIRYLIKTLFKSKYKIMEAEDGEVGIKIAGRIIPDLIICDIMMPHKDGFEVTRILKSNVITSHIPIIILTACTEDEQKMLGFEYGADAYIQKPFNNDLLEINVRKLIEGRLKLKEFYSNNINLLDKRSLKNVEQQFLDKFEQFVVDNIDNSNLDITDITQYLGFSRAQLYRKIKSLTNCSPTDMIRVIRLKYAASIMLKGISVTDAAYLSGFSSPSYFTKSFKDFFKMNPSEYVKVNKL